MAGIAFALIAPAASYAQLNLQQFGFGSGKSEVAAGANGAAQPSALNSLVQNYLGANQQVLSGQSSPASAMGMSSVASQAQSAAGLLSGASGGSGVPSSSVLSQLGGTQQSVSQSLMQAFSNGTATPPTAANKQTFSDGLTSLEQGVKQYAGLLGSRFREELDEHVVAAAGRLESRDRAGGDVYRAVRAGVTAIAHADAHAGRAVRENQRHLGAVRRDLRPERREVT
ncbi:hypothetical protein BPUN_0002 [Candidatus Paraburkholderia kirkii]|nr:hypothetical protein BPUN_3255 [Candidatus Paraburkholderia kirkii]KND56559.1 hypothetical protein BPUN_0002 [Candidatus Paraburkholderia kirkii]